MLHLDGLFLRELRMRTLYSRIIIPTRPFLPQKQVPQLSAVSKEGGEAELEQTRSDMMKAIHSIPAYIERTSHFFAVCPAVPHRDLDGVICDFGSWLKRGWCRLEQVRKLSWPPPPPEPRPGSLHRALCRASAG